MSKTAKVIPFPVSIESNEQNHRKVFILLLFGNLC